MEIWSYLWGRRGRIAMLVLLPVAVAIISALYVSSNSSTQYSATMEVAVPNTSGPGANAAGAQIVNFVTAATSDGVRAGVSSKLGIPRGTIAANLTVAQLDNTGSYVKISYTGASRTTAAAVTQQVASLATSALLDPLINAQQGTRDSLLKQYSAIGSSLPPSSDPKGLSRKELIRQQQGLLLQSVNTVNSQLALVTAQRDTTLAQVAQPDAVVTSLVSRQSKVFKTTLLNTGIALFAAVILIFAWDIVRPPAGARANRSIAAADTATT